MLNSKRRTSTLFRAVYIPTIFVVYMSFIIKVYWPHETYGVGNPSTIRPLSQAIADASSKRKTLALCNYGPRGGDLDRVIDSVAAKAKGDAGQIVEVLHDPEELLTLCKSSLSGVTKCYGAAEFYSSPKEGGVWNYTIRVDGSHGYKINVKNNKNDAEVYVIPLQHAVDSAIAEINSSGGSKPLSDTIQEYPYTSKTQKEWDDSVVTSIQSAITKYIAIVWYIGFIGLSYQLVGIMAREREDGMADLLESMMPNVDRWQPQFARLCGRWIAFSIVSSAFCPEASFSDGSRFIFRHGLSLPSLPRLASFRKRVPVSSSYIVSCPALVSTLFRYLGLHSSNGHSSVASLLRW